MARYSAGQYREIHLLPQGTYAVRFHCPTCGSLHAIMNQGDESQCQSCGHMLILADDELYVSEIPSQWQEEEYIDPDWEE